MEAARGAGLDAVLSDDLHNPDRWNAVSNVVAAGRLGINQFKGAAARRERQQWAGAADGVDDTFGVDESNMAAIDGLALFDDAIFWTEVQLETPFSGGQAADLTNYSQRNGSFHVRRSGSHRAAAVYGSSHGGSRHLSYASPHGSKHAVDVACKDVASPREPAASNGSGLYATGAKSPSSPAGKQTAGDQAV